MPARAFRIVLPLLLAVALALPPGVDGRSPHAGDTPTGSPLRSLPGSQSVAVPPRGLIVKYRDATAPGTRAAIRRVESLSSAGPVGRTSFETVEPRGRSLAAAAAALRNHPGVELVVPDAHRTAFADPTGEEHWNLQWGHHNVGQLINGFIGIADADVDGLESLAATPGSESVVVAVVDDGVDFGHPELAGRQWVNPGESGPDGIGADRATNGLDDDGNGYVDDVNGWDFCNDDNTVHDFGQDAHGTGVAGVIAASIDGQGTAGLAPATRIMALKFLQNEPDPANPSCGWDSQAIAAIQYAASFGVRIINASWGGDDADPLLEGVIASSGALFVAAAGNDGRNIDLAPSYPAAFSAPNILSVGAIHNEGGPAVFTNYGPVGVDLVAPGDDIVVPCPADASYPAGSCMDRGTSFAAPFVAAVAALVGAVNPTMLAAPAALRERILATAAPLPSTAGLTATGRLVNARRALDFTAPTLAGSPSVVPLAPSVLGPSSVTVRVAWPAATDDLEMGSYRLEQRRDGGQWTVVRDWTAALHADVVVGLTGSHAFRVTPRDAFGNAGAPASVEFHPTRFEQGSASARVTGAWRTAFSTAASGGRTRYTSGRKASLTFVFEGRAVALVVPRGRGRDSFSVYLDNRFIRTVSLYARTTQNRQVVYASDWLPAGRHVLRLVNTWASGRTRGEVDAFVVIR